MQSLHWIIKLSRPRFWFYLLGPLLLGVAAYPFFKFSLSGGNFQIGLMLAVLFFTLPANLLIYGINDLFDYDTDKHNQKKKSYELLLQPSQRRRFISLLLYVIVPSLSLLILSLIFTANHSDALSLRYDPNIPALWALAGFLFFGIGYSAPPVRAKARPLIDSFFNILYIFPGLVSYAILTEQFPPVSIIIAATLWCMAMHAYSAVPDITADNKARVATIATTLGRNNTIQLCGFAYLLASALVYDRLGWMSAIGSIVYTTLMILSYRASTPKELFSLYKAFPYINVGYGFLLFWYIVLFAR